MRLRGSQLYAINAAIKSGGDVHAAIQNTCAQVEAVGVAVNAPASFWTLDEALDLCAKVEAICPRFGCHVALTGGLLYKSGQRKDCDLLFYRIRQVGDIDFKGLWAELDKRLGLKQTTGFGWCYKGTFNGKALDMFSPEEQGGEYGDEPTL